MSTAKGSVALALQAGSTSEEPYRLVPAGAVGREGRAIRSARQQVKRAVKRLEALPGAAPPCRACAAARALHLAAGRLWDALRRN